MELLIKEVESTIAQIEGSTCENLTGRQVVSDKEEKDQDMEKRQKRENEIGRRERSEQTEKREKRIRYWAMPNGF
jgi:hypothetical protein